MAWMAWGTRRSILSVSTFNTETPKRPLATA
ncbi:Uncharacterised protein [Vibrio cholerae]|nr:Uncharacterised protein [Vibrio cholerae]